MYYALVLTIVCFLAAIVAAISLPALVLPIIVFSLLTDVMAFVGRLFCLSAPEQSGRSLIYAAVALDAIAIFVAVAQMVVEIPSLFHSLPALIASILFVLFLKTLADSLRQPELAQKAVRILKLGIAVVVVMLVAALSLFVAPPVMLAVGPITLVLGLAMLIYYARLLSGLKEVLRP